MSGLSDVGHGPTQYFEAISGCTLRSKACLIAPLCMLCPISKSVPFETVLSHFSTLLACELNLPLYLIIFQIFIWFIVKPFPPSIPIWHRLEIMSILI